MLLTGLIYSLLIMWFYFGWRKIKHYTPVSGPYPSISIIVAARNEQKHTGRLIKQLLEQRYPKDKYEVIIVNDHSNDKTPFIVKENDPGERIKLIHLKEGVSGKKNAITTGIREASGTLIVTTDADCIPSNHWLEAIARAYACNKYKMIAGPVVVTNPKGFTGKFQAIELLSLVASGAGAISVNQPIMCNGANLAYEKAAFEQVAGFKGNEHIPGGDDIFLLEKFKRAFSGKAIAFLKEKEAIVLTEGVSGIREFIHQRIRWVSKSHAYRDPFMILTALIVLLLNTAILLAGIVGLFNPLFFYVFGILFLLKSFVDYILLWDISRFARQRHLMKWFPLMQLIYFPFISFIGLAGNMLAYRWKGR